MTSIDKLPDWNYNIQIMSTTISGGKNGAVQHTTISLINRGLQEPKATINLLLKILHRFLRSN